MAGRPIPIDPGTRFGKLTVVAPGDGRLRLGGYRSATSVCECDCGSTVDVPNAVLRSGESKSCGCIRLHLNGLSRKSPHYFRWKKMIDRCCNPNSNGYSNYGARGISVCERWQNSFFDYLSDIAKLGEQPTPEHTIDRIDNNGNYELGNIRWATPTEQQNNNRQTRFIEFNNEVRSVAQWAYFLGIAVGTLYARLSLGWPIDRAFAPPARPRKKKASRDGD